MRNGEFGTNSPANLESWYKYIPEGSRWPIDNNDPILLRKNALRQLGPQRGGVAACP